MSEDGVESSTRNGPLRLDAGALESLVPVRRLTGRNTTKADVLVYDAGGRSIALKDYGPRPFWIRQTVGRLLTAREAAAYRAADGIPGLPRFHGRLGPWALALDWVEADPLSALSGRLPPEIFDALDAVVARLHARGIALGDLHHRDVLVDAEARVWVVDLATAWVLGPEPSSWRRRVFARLAGNDLVAAARLRARFTGIPEAEALTGVPEEAIRWHARGRRWRAIWDRVRGRS